MWGTPGLGEQEHITGGPRDSPVLQPSLDDFASRGCLAMSGGHTCAGEGYCHLVDGDQGCRSTPHSAQDSCHHGEQPSRKCQQCRGRENGSLHERVYPSIYLSIYHLSIIYISIYHRSISIYYLSIYIYLSIYL